MDNAAIIEQALAHNIPVKALNRDRHAVEHIIKFTRSEDHRSHRAVYIDKDESNTIIDLDLPGEQLGRWIIDAGELDRLSRQLMEVKAKDTVAMLAPWAELIDLPIDQIPFGVGDYIEIRHKDLLQPGQEQDDLTYRVSRLFKTDIDPCVMATGHTMYEGRIVVFVGEAWRFQLAATDKTKEASDV